MDNVPGSVTNSVSAVGPLYFICHFGELFSISGGYITNRPGVAGAVQ